MKEVEVEQLLGHTGGWSNEAYNRPPPEWLVEEYLKAVPDQTQQNEVLEQTQTLMTQMEFKEQEITELKGHMNEMGDMMNRMQQKIMKLNSTVERNMKEHRWYVNQYGLSDPFKKKLKESMNE